MKNYYKWLLLASMNILVVANLMAQRITNIVPTIEGKEIVVTYDLVSELTDAKCEVVFYFGDNAAQNNLLKEASGDIGKDITIGAGKQIRIANIQPFLPYMKNLTFRAEAKYTYTPINKLNSLAGTKVKKKSTIPLTWEGGAKGEAISLSLMQNGRMIGKSIAINNNNGYNFVLPEIAKKGSGYEIIVKNYAGKEINTDVFSVKPKISGAVIVLLSAVVVGGVVFVLLNKKGTSPDNIEILGLPALAEGAHPGG